MISTERLCMGCMNDNGGEQVCPICGFDAKAKNPRNTLTIKTLLNDRFLVGRVLSANGEGIKYIGWDTANDAIVNIMEYFPDGVAKRNPDKTVSMIKGHEYTYNEGLLEFLEINKAIKNSDLPSLIPVLEVFEENGTAFAIFKVVEGVTLSDFLSRNGGTLKWEQARALFLPLIDTVKGMHELGIIHKGISTETIIVGRDGKLYLSGYAINKFRYENEEIKFEIFDGFAAAEQYANTDMHIDTYTDVYAFCATLFNVLIGTLPAKATARLENDVMSIPSKFAEELPRQVLFSLANALQVRPADRTKDMEALKNQLVYGEIPNAAVKSDKNSASKKGAKAKKSGSAKYVLVSTICTILAFVAVGIILMFTAFKDQLFGNKQPVDTPSSNTPNVESIGSSSGQNDEIEKFYSVPDLTGQYYADVIDNENNEVFEFVIIDKEFSSQPRGTICYQSVAKGTSVKKETKIEVIISLGPKEFRMPSLLNKTESEAKLELLKLGFLYGNIRVREEFGENQTAPVVINQYPAAGEKVNADIYIEIYINTNTFDSGDALN